MTNKQIIKQINERIITLDTEEINTINELLIYHECEPMAQAERIAAFLNVNYECMHDIIFELQ